MPGEIKTNRVELYLDESNVAGIDSEFTVGGIYVVGPDGDDKTTKTQWYTIRRMAWQQIQRNKQLWPEKNPDDKKPERRELFLGTLENLKLPTGLTIKAIKLTNNQSVQGQRAKQHYDGIQLHQEMLRKLVILFIQVLLPKLGQISKVSVIYETAIRVMHQNIADTEPLKSFKSVPIAKNNVIIFSITDQVLNEKSALIGGVSIREYLRLEKIDFNSEAITTLENIPTNKLFHPLLHLADAIVSARQPSLAIEELYKPPLGMEEQNIKLLDNFIKAGASFQKGDYPDAFSTIVQDSTWSAVEQVWEKADQQRVKNTGRFYICQRLGKACRDKIKTKEDFYNIV